MYHRCFPSSHPLSFLPSAILYSSQCLLLFICDYIHHFNTEIFVLNALKLQSQTIENQRGNCFKSNRLVICMFQCNDMLCFSLQSDVWALGCCVYEMSTLKHAFNAKDMNSLAYRIVEGKVCQMFKSQLNLFVKMLYCTL